MKRFLCIIIFFILISVVVSGVGWISPEEEAPRALFQSKIGESDVDFMIDGSWLTDASYSFGLLYRRGNPVEFLDYFPGETMGFAYQNLPDLTLSVWLREKYFLELSILGGFSENSFLMGYEGDESDFLKILHIGNRDIGFEPFPFIEIPGTGNSSLGAEAYLSSGEMATHHILLRYDSQGKESVVFLGRNQLEEERIGIKKYIHGRFFYLPDRDIENLLVYREDPKGNLTASDGLRYSIVPTNEYTFFNKNGLLTFKDSEEVRILIYYEKDGKEIGDSELGRGALPGTSEVTAGVYAFDFDASPVDFNWATNYMGKSMSERHIEIGARSVFLLYDPKAFNPFEIANSYQFKSDIPKDVSDVKVKLVKIGTDKEKDMGDYKISFNVLKDEKRIEVTVPVSSSATSGIYFRQFFPFPDPDGNIYGPDSFLQGEDEDYEIQLKILKPVDDYSLGEGVIPGSVHILRNGIEENRFKVDYSSGKIQFETTIYPTDLIEVSYMKEGLASRGGDIVFGWGNRFKINEYLGLELASALRWNILSGSYSTAEQSRTGSIIASAGIEYSKKNISIGFEGAVGFTNPDTTGILRIEGMEGYGNNVQFSSDNIYPASVPVAMPDGITDISVDTRGKLFYKDYRSYGPLGSVSMFYFEDNIPSDQVYPYETGSKVGPYIAGGSSDGRTGYSLVLDYDIQQEKTWVGSIITLSDSGNRDLSGTDSISVSYMCDAIDGNVSLYIQVGEISEDLDDDSRLDTETDESSHGFDFNDTSNGAVLLVGGGPKNEGNARIDSEDLDKNGFLDSEESEYVVSSSGIDITGDTGWKVYTFYLSNTQRKLLKKSRAIRLLVVKRASGNVKGRILIDRISLNGSPYWAKSVPSGSVSAREIDEKEGLFPPDSGQDCVSVFPEVKNVFHREGEEQDVLEVNWDSIPSSGSWKVGKYYVNAFNPFMYRNLVFYLRVPSADVNETTFFFMKLISDSGNELEIDLDLLNSPLTDSKWHRVVVDLDEKEIDIDGKAFDGTVKNSISGISTTISITSIQFGIQGSEKGTLYLDEIHLRESAGRFGGAITLSGNAEIPGKIFKIGNLPVLSDIGLSLTSHFITPGFSTLYGVPSSALGYDSDLKVKANIVGVSLDFGSILIGRNKDIGLVFQHTLTFPIWKLPVRVADSYSNSYLDYMPVSARNNSIDLSAGKMVNINLDYQNLHRESIISRKWKVSMSFAPIEIASTSNSLTVGLSEINNKYSRTNYFKDWFRSLMLILPEDAGEDSERSIAFVSDLMIGYPQIATKFNADIDVKSYGYSENLQKTNDGLTMNLSFPFSFEYPEKNNISVNPTYTRELQIDDKIVIQKNVISDLSNYWSEIAASNFVFSNIPFSEIFDRKSIDIFKTATRFANNVKYKPSFDMSISRDYGSRLLDLFVPSIINFSLGRELSKNYDSYSDTGTLSAGIRNTALNLFGIMGAYPFFGFYSTDEWNLTLNNETTVIDWNEIESFSFLFDVYVNFTGDFAGYEKWDLTLENKLKFEMGDSYKLEDEGSITYSWRVYPDFLAIYMPENSYLRNREKIGYSFQYSFENSNSMTVMVEHSTGLEMLKVGSIRVSLGTGLSWGNDTIRALIKLSLEGKMSF